MRAKANIAIEDFITWSAGRGYTMKDSAGLGMPYDLMRAWPGARGAKALPFIVGDVVEATEDVERWGYKAPKGSRGKIVRMWKARHRATCVFPGTIFQHSAETFESEVYLEYLKLIPGPFPRNAAGEEEWWR